MNGFALINERMKALAGKTIEINEDRAETSPLQEHS
jgi:hypothetical protein